MEQNPVGKSIYLAGFGTSQKPLKSRGCSSLANIIMGLVAAGIEVAKRMQDSASFGNFLTNGLKSTEVGAAAAASAIVCAADGSEMDFLS